MRFTRAIVRIPCERIAEGLSSSGFGKPDYSKAIMQHEKYVRALEDCGLEVIVLPPDNDFPDSTFVEDTALLTPVVAVITLPGAPSRKGEIREGTITPGDLDKYQKVKLINAMNDLQHAPEIPIDSIYF